MTIHEVMNAVATLGGERDATIQRLTEQIAEKDAKIRELEEKASSWRERAKYYHNAAIDRIDCHRAAEAAEQPAPPDDGEIVPWTFETFPPDCEWLRYRGDQSQRCRVLRVDQQGATAAWVGGKLWDELLDSWEWSRDGITFHPCGKREAPSK